MSKLDNAKQKGIYLLPNLFTTGAMFAGYYSIIAGIQGKFEMACLSIFIAALLDALDGRVARLTNTQSEFGEQYDSLSDLVSFGVAPSLLVFNWSLFHLSAVHPVMGKIGWLAAFIFAVSGALRLARFNTQIGVVDKAYFQGLPSPAAAGLISSFVWICVDLDLVGADLKYITLPLTIVVGLLMVSRFRYYSFKTIPFKENVSFIWILLLVLVFVLLTIKTAWVLFVVFCGYGVSGILFTVHSVKKKRASKKNNKPTEPDESK
ncbi:CDP-diacylglycerol--serine O-phosphatidyltransferase [Marinicella litoralis]|uniref:CDP-diacylglycerol--serine O-phosphatidyltransferase n=1 Tax=Marinicella litoralis TaxID=644220 RepID=A0A4R6XMF0_9GAMM|nr:CDP-diacylglycerol--serine O-phosphatidyltransferase [Marinicella litoralis]TDR20835.1 CDP-diacylglycerol--serine O-phosphatidyltransferase [Marinicella litoralis]